MVSEIFQKVADFVVREGDRLPALSGNAPDHYKAKQWSTEHDHAIEEH